MTHVLCQNRYYHPRPYIYVSLNIFCSDCKFFSDKAEQKKREQAQVFGVYLIVIDFALKCCTGGAQVVFCVFLM